MDKDLLYLIPFYDLKHMRSGKKRDTKLVKVRNICAKEYKEIMKAEMLATASSLQVKEEEAAPAPVQSKPKPKPKPKKRVIVEESEEEEEEEEEEEILDDAEIARRERAPHKDDPKFEKVDPAWKAQYADVAWVASQGFEHWPSIIYDPRWTKGNINAAGMRYLGKKHVCLFYAMDASERFAYEPLASIVPWEEGLRRGYDKKASNFKPKKYEKAFPKALAEATEEHAKDKEHRSFRDAHDTTKKKPPAKKKKVARRDDDDFISKEDSDDDMAALRAKTKSAPKARKEPVAKKPRTDDEKRRALEALAAKKRQRDEAAQKDKADRERRMKDAARSGVPVWKQLSDRPGDKTAPKSPPKAAAPVQLPNDARGLVEALKRATVGGEKSAEVGSEWGREMPLRKALEERLQRFCRVPRLMLAVQGGRGTFDAIVQAVVSGCPVVVARESGGAAELV